MAYIGKSPVIGNFVKLDAITVVNGQSCIHYAKWWLKLHRL